MKLVIICILNFILFVIVMLTAASGQIGPPDVKFMLGTPTHIAYVYVAQKCPRRIIGNFVSISRHTQGISI
jgi:hypothetical protein